MKQTKNIIWGIVLGIVIIGCDPESNPSVEKRDTDSETDTVTDTTMNTDPVNDCEDTHDPCADPDGGVIDGCFVGCGGWFNPDCPTSTGFEFECIMIAPQICEGDSATDEPDLGVCLPSESVECKEDADCCFPIPSVKGWCRGNVNWECQSNKCALHCDCSGEYRSPVLRTLIQINLPPGNRSIPSDGVARRSNTSGILRSSRLVSRALQLPTWQIYFGQYPKRFNSLAALF